MARLLRGSRTISEGVSQTELDAVSTVASAALPLAGGTMSGNIVMGDDTSIGIADDAERIEFDGAGDISILGANLGVGTDNPGGAIDVHNTASGYTCYNSDQSIATEMVLNCYHSSSGTAYGISVQWASTVTNNGNGSHNWFFRGIHSASTIAFQIWDDGDVQNVNGTYGDALSDERLKTNITDANSQWDDVKSINIVNYKKLTEGGVNDFSRLGVIAQQAEGVSPNLIKVRVPAVEEIKANPLFGTLYEEGDDIPDGKVVGDVKEVKEMVKTFKDSIFFWKCAKALQEAMAKIETLETKVTALESA